MPPREGGRRSIDRIADPAYLAGLEDRSADAVREMKAECEKEEAVLSYERRLLHARLDIMRDELQRRGAGGEAPDIVERLTRVLTDERRPSRGAFPKDVPIEPIDRPRRRVEKLISDDTLARLPDLAEGEIGDLIGAIESVEGELSADRRKVQDVLDAINAEIVRRYRSGGTPPPQAVAGT
jgi:hypothetical protein